MKRILPVDHLSDFLVKYVVFIMVKGLSGTFHGKKDLCLIQGSENTNVKPPKGQFQMVSASAD